MRMEGSGERGFCLWVFMKNRIAGIPLGRIAETSDLVGLVLFLASDASSYISGQVILADGGEIA